MPAKANIHKPNSTQTTTTVHVDDFGETALVPVAARDGEGAGVVSFAASAGTDCATSRES